MNQKQSTSAASELEQPPRPFSMVVPRSAEGEGEHALRQSVIGLYCPLASGINPAAAIAQERSLEWALAAGLVQEGNAALALDRARVAHLGALVFRSASVEVLELAAQWTTLFCILDDHIESCRSSTMRIAAFLQLALTAFSGPGMPTGEPIVDAFGALGANMLQLGGEGLTRRFAAELERLFEGYLWEEFYRQTDSIPDYGAYRALRTITIGLRPQFLLGELERRCSDTRQVRLDAAIRAMEDMTCRAVGWANDIFTHEKELEQGEPLNLVAVLMQSQSLSRHDALKHARDLHDAEVRSLLSAEALLPDFGSVTGAARAHVKHLHHWVRGHLDWAVLTRRYDPAVERPVQW